MDRAGRDKASHWHDMGRPGLPDGAQSRDLGEEFIVCLLFVSNAQAAKALGRLMEYRDDPHPTDRRSHVLYSTCTAFVQIGTIG